MSRPRSFTCAALLLCCTALILASCAGSGNATQTRNNAISTDASGNLDTPPRPLEDYDRALVLTTLRESALDLLETAAFDRSPMLRANALEALQVVPHRAEPIARAGLTDENAGVRFTALMTVGKLKLESSRPFIRPLLRDTDPRVQMAAIYALHRLDEPVDQTPLARHLLNGQPQVRAQAAYIIGEIGNPSAIPLLRDTAAPVEPPNPTGGKLPERRRPDQVLLHLQIAEALIKLGDQRVGHVLHSALYPAVRDDLEAAVLAAQILGELRDETAIRQLVELIEQVTPDSPETDDPRRRIFLQPIELRLAAATAVAKMGDTGGVYVADLAIRSPDPAVRSQACFLYAAAARIRDYSPSSRTSRRLDLAKLERLMNDPNALVQVSAAAGILRAIENSGR